MKFEWTPIADGTDVANVPGGCVIASYGDDPDLAPTMVYVPMVAAVGMGDGVRLVSTMAGQFEQVMGQVRRSIDGI